MGNLINVAIAVAVAVVVLRTVVFIVKQQSCAIVESD